MPKILFTLLLSLMLLGGAFAQNVQWASTVLEFSTQLSDKQYSAQQVLNKPNVLPNTGESPNAWTPRNPNSIEFIKVGFETPIKIQQIALGESYNPGSVKRVFLYDEENQEHLVYDFDPKPAGIKG